MIIFSDAPLLSSTILNSHENEKETQTSNDLIEKSLQLDISNEYFASLEESYTEINHRQYTLQTQNEMLEVGTKNGSIRMMKKFYLILDLLILKFCEQSLIFSLQYWVKITELC